MNENWTTFYAPLDALVMAPRYDSERQPYWKKCATQLIGWRFEYDDHGLACLHYLTVRGTEVIGDHLPDETPGREDFGRNYYLWHLENREATEL